MECTIDIDVDSISIDYSELALQLEIGDIAECIASSDVAEYVIESMDFDNLTTDIASRVNVQSEDIAEHFSACDIAMDVDMDSLADSIDVESLARHVDTTKIAHELTADLLFHEKLTTLIDRHVTRVVEQKLTELQPPKKESIWHTLTSILRLRKH